MNVSLSGDQAMLDVLQMLSHYLVMLALFRRLRQGSERWTPPRSAASPRLLARSASYVMVAFVMVALPVMIGLALSAPAGSLTRLVLAVASAVLALLTVVRTVLTAIESGRLFHSSMTDPLTGLYNHRHFHEQLRALVDVAGRFEGKLSVVAFDLDGFDEVNDRHGHPAGDELLREVASALAASCEGECVMCRVGGDEFAALLPGADTAEALEMAGRVRRSLAAIATPDGVPITVSSGVAVYPVHAREAESLIRLADGAAYWVKRHGKDQALVYDPAVVTELSPDDVVRAIERQAESDIVRALAAAVDARHEFTSTHSVAVAAWSTDVARRLGMSDERIRLVETAALLHDVGMIAVGEGLIDKPEPLSDEERAEIRTHPHLGEQIVAGTMPAAVVDVIRHHHENWDGAGYPDGLRAVAIPVEARILHVCGSYDAMTSPRPFRPAMSMAEAIAQLRAGSGIQFDPEIVETFLEGLGALGRVRDDL
jgi:diguanylate cyclase (GGDEF)-like protein/putative nucleotidyltransferase with HDIG domain